MADCLNFSEAARRMNITQPSLSRQIASLEQELAVQLFDRNTKKVSLTLAGQVLLVEAREIIRHCDSIQTLSQRLNKGYLGRLSVGYSSAIGSNFIARFLQGVREHQTQIEIVLHRQNQGRLIAGLKSGEVDVAFLFRNGLVESYGLKTITVGQSVLSLVLTRDHEWANRKSIDIQELQGVPISIMDRNESTSAHDYFLALCRQNEVIPDFIQFCDDPQVLLMNVIAGKSSAVLPITVGEPRPYQLAAVPLRCGKEIVGEDLVLAYCADYRNEAINTFLSWTRKFTGKIGCGAKEP